ncbi:hypothetical protein C1T17_14370 [Sphingobium sp. SCG-1]|uniref:hypothetical protein n=1 Tax=Sphingobium sp. SCG-1 TaxID=2072936 RepID=UPI000CD67A1D|nr:hypothetical protein [Sphingobium sp. SCG-1]AUW59101.1 hypothetical protein C1T17_14370 [Sphingobium sp. SCG-1]
MRLSLFALALCLAAPAVAQAEETDNWTTAADTVHARAAGISLPQQAGSLTIVKTGEVSDQGPGTDSYAQYISEDNVVQATVFIYKPGFADTAIAALGTERALIERFGPATQRISQNVTAAGGRDGVALRTIYSGAAEGQLVLAAAFIRSGDFIVKLRVTATSDRLADVEAGLDGILKAMRFDTPDDLRAANLVKVADCASAAQSRPTLTTPSFPRDGADALCRRGVVTVGDASFDMLQPAGRDAASALLVPTDDAGGLLRFDRIADGSGYRLTRYGAEAGGAPVQYKALPDAQQIAAIIGGKGANPAKNTATALK